MWHWMWWFSALPALHAPDRSAAVAAVVRDLRDHPVVAIAESHWIAEAGEFYDALVRDSAFEALGPDIVVEFASGQSQALLDRYVVDGDSLPPDSVASIWRNTTKVAAWESPIYGRWLRVIREVNRTLPAGRRLRVLAGDTPVEWARLHSREDWIRLGDNNRSFAAVIGDRVLARGRRALVVLGSNHLMRTGDRDGGPNTATRVEQRFPGALYVIWLFNGRPGGRDASTRIAREAWPVPSVHALAGTWLGATAAGRARFQDIADAVLYLGPPDSLQVLPPPADAYDASYRRELRRRSWIEWGDSSRAGAFLGLPTVDSFTVPLAAPDAPRRVWVYTSPGYNASAAAADLIVAFDGGEYVTSMRLPAILDSLVNSGRLRPVVALLIDNGSSTSRLADLANHARFVGPVMDQLVSWLRRRRRVTTDPRRTLVTGSSAGGLAAAYLAFVRPDVFGNVLSQSGAFWRGNEGSDDPPYEWLTSQFENAPRRSVRFYLDVGSTESGGALGGTAPSILTANRRLRSVLQTKGYEVLYAEIPGGRHTPESWSVRISGGLTALLAPADNPVHSR